MPSNLFANNAKSTLSVAVSSNSQATLTLQSGHGARFPTPKPPDFYRVTLDDGVNIEICKVIDISGDALTVLRGFERTVAQSSFATGTKVELRLTADTLDWLQETGLGLMGYYVRPQYSVNSWQFLGYPAPTKVGTDTFGTLSASSWLESSNRMKLTCGNSAQFPIHHRMAQPVVNIYNGFTFRWRFAVDIQPSSSHCFIGLINTTGVVNSVHPPTSMIAMIGVGWSPGSTQNNLRLYWNDAASIATYWDLGSYFSLQNTLSVYEMRLDARPKSGRIDYRIRRMDVSSIPDVNSYFTQFIPSNSAWLSPMMHAASMVTSAVALENLGYAWWT